VSSNRPGARELARQAVAAQVSEMALDLFLENGYDQTTVEDICAVAGISRSTFFRYFPTKEDVFVVKTAAVPEELLRNLQKRPDDEPVWTALRHALGGVLEHYGSPPERALRLARLGRTTPVLALRNREKLASAQQLLAPEIARRLGADPGDPADPRPHAVTAALFGCLEATLAVWAAGNGAQPLPEILDRAMSALD
jgi:AcrR family transcriptional regulator